MDEHTERLEVSQGALVVLSKIPFSCNLKRNLKEDSVWLPKLLIAIPSKEKPFIVYEGIEQKGTDLYIKRGNGMCIWHGDKDIEKTLNLHGYVFVPGEKESECLKNINTIENGFIPDEKDPNQQKLDSHIFSGMDTFSYSDSMHHRFLTANVRIKDLPQIVYNCMFSPGLSTIGYDCEHSGDIGLNSKMEGKLKGSKEQKWKATKVILKDLEGKLNTKIIR